MLAPWPIGDKRTCRSDLCNNAAPLFAAKFWEKKPYEQWSKKEALKVLEDSLRRYFCATLIGDACVAENQTSPVSWNWAND